jgi:hypothetical protein
MLCYGIVPNDPNSYFLYRIKWPWLNYFNGTAAGFFLGFITALLIFLTPVEGKFSEALGNFANGLPTLKGMMLAATNAFVFGFVGAVYGLVFWAIAVRLTPPLPSERDHDGAMVG